MKRLSGAAGHNKQGNVSRQVPAENSMREELQACRSAGTRSDQGEMRMQVPTYRDNHRSDCITRRFGNM